MINHTHSHACESQSHACELKPCPFCGGPGKTYTDVQRDIDCAGTRTVWRVRCGARADCALLMGHFPTEEDAIAAWNTRNGDRTLSMFGEEKKA